MSKSNSKKEKTDISINGKQVTQKLKDLLLGQEERPYVVKEAVIKDDFCNYTYEIISGVGIGDTHNVKGSGIIDDDMRKAFAVLNVHLAVIDDAFKLSGIDIKNIDKEHGHDLTMLYRVTGFKITGGSDSEAIMLIGNKYVSAGGRVELKMLKIPMDNISSYTWYNELKAAADKARLEVALYKEGKCTPVEVEEDEEDPNQSKLPFGENDDYGVDADFEEAAL